MTLLDYEFLKHKVLAAAACAVAFSALPASAVTVALTPTNSGYTGSFTQPVSGFAFDDYDFTPASVSGMVSVTLSSVDPTKLFTATLNGVDFSYDPSLSPVFSFETSVSNAPLTLSVFAAAVDDMGDLLTGSYSGTVNVAAAVPEPATWGLLFAGLGLVGAAAARRRRSETPALLSN